MATAPDAATGHRRTDRLGRALCLRFVELLPVSGASISLVSASGAHSTIGATDELAARLEARQFELGVGPHWEALRTGRPAVLYEASDEAAQTSWQDLVGDVIRGDAGALLSFPLQLGAATVGVADLYSRSAEPWPKETIETAQDVASSIATSAVRLATRSADDETSTTSRDPVELRREVHQAVGMVMGQLDCTASSALLRLRAHAFATETPLDRLANDVVARRVDFADL